MEKNTQLTQELEECKAQLRAAVAKMEESQKAPSSNPCSYRKEYTDIYQLVFGMHANLTVDSADNPGGNPEIVPGDEQHAQRAYTGYSREK